MRLWSCTIAGAQASWRTRATTAAARSGQRSLADATGPLENSRMRDARYKELLREWGHKLQANSLAPRAFDALRGRADEATRTALSIMRRENPGFTFDEIFTAQ